MKRLSLEDLADAVNGFADQAQVSEDDLALLSDVKQSLQDQDLAGPTAALTQAVLTLPEVDSPDVEVMAMEVDVRAPTPSEGPSESFRYARAGHREIDATSDEVALTMSLDRADAHHGELVVGHLRDRTRSTGLADVTVHISDERKTLASTLTNQLGDFHIEVPTGEGTLLTVMLEPGRQIRIRLA